MQEYDDYYKILQVHYLAEPEIIESAYRGLAKKYHPDVCNIEDSEERMKMINQAYEVLSDPERRRQYNLEWKNKHNKSCEGDCNQKNTHGRNVKSFTAAKYVLDEYFRGIMNNYFDGSYELISEADKRSITRDDFISWQSAVSKVFHIKEYSLRICALSKGKKLDGHIFSDAVEFNVSVFEYNTVMDMVEKDNFTKIVVLENRKWRVYLGYENLQPLINKYKSLTGLLAAKTVIRELVETYNRIDNLSGLLNQRGIIERIENEIQRYDRYGNIFSLIMCDADIAKRVNESMKQDVKEYVVKFTGKMLVNSLRKLDVVGRWGEKSFLILLPETEYLSAVEVTKKIDAIFRNKKMLYEGSAWRITVEFKAVEYESSLEEVLDRIYSFINI